MASDWEPLRFDPAVGVNLARARQRNRHGPAVRLAIPVAVPADEHTRIGELRHWIACADVALWAEREEST